MTATPAQEDTMTPTTLRTPVEVDTDLAAAHREWARILRYLDDINDTAKCITADARKIRVRYGRRGAEFPFTAAEAWEYIESLPADAYLGSGRYQHKLIAERDELRAENNRIQERIRALNTEYRGWSRFYLVTSSAGHVHSSMSCSTCRPTTTYGWLPKLSGQTEAEAVAQLGAVLCSVCFPTAPLENTGGRITRARALAMAA